MICRQCCIAFQTGSLRLKYLYLHFHERDDVRGQQGAYCHKLRRYFLRWGKRRWKFPREKQIPLQDVTGIKTTLIGPQGHVSARTGASVAMIDTGLQRLYGNLEKLFYKHTNLLSCMTQDVENCHSTVHVWRIWWKQRLRSWRLSGVTADSDPPAQIR